MVRKAFPIRVLLSIFVAFVLVGGVVAAGAVLRNDDSTGSSATGSAAADHDDRPSIPHHDHDHAAPRHDTDHPRDHPAGSGHEPPRGQLRDDDRSGLGPGGRGTVRAATRRLEVRPGPRRRQVRPGDDLRGAGSPEARRVPAGRAHRCGGSRLHRQLPIRDPDPPRRGAEPHRDRHLEAGHHALRELPAAPDHDDIDRERADVLLRHAEARADAAHLRGGDDTERSLPVLLLLRRLAGRRPREALQPVLLLQGSGDPRVRLGADRAGVTRMLADPDAHRRLLAHVGARR